MYQNLIEAKILTGCAMGKKIFLPKILLYLNDFPVQFLIKVCFNICLISARSNIIQLWSWFGK